MAAHGGERHSESLGNLLGVEVFLIAEQDDGALLLGEGVEKLLDAVHEGGVGRRDFRRGHEGFVVNLEVLTASGGAAAPGVRGAMAGDAAEPCSEMIGAGYGGQSVVALKEDVLGYFFGCGVVAEDAEGDGEDARLMLGDDGLELLAVGFHLGFLGGSPDVLHRGIRKLGWEMMQKNAVGSFSCQFSVFSGQFSVPSCQIWVCSGAPFVDSHLYFH